MIELRYVVLRHEGVPEPHFDFMFENTPGGNLATWRIDRWPPHPGATLTQLGNHRRDYLHYEGPLTNNRGHVRRIEAGQCTRQQTQAAPPAITIRLRDPSNIVFTIQQVGPQAQWRVTE